MSSPSDIDHQKFIFSKFYDNLGVKISMITLDYGNPVMVNSGPIKITYYGIPRLDPNFCPDDSCRNHIIIGFDTEQDNCNQLKMAFQSIDTYADSDAFRKKIFKYDHNKYQYCSLVRIKSSDSTKTPLPDYCKIKFNNKKGVIKSVLKVNGNIVPIKTVTELTNYIKFLSTVTLKIRIHKLWATKSKISTNQKYMYGIGLVLEEVSINSESKFVDYGVPNYTLKDIQQSYKKYMNDVKKTKIKSLEIEI